MFDTAVANRIRSYVYALIDPRTDRPFYVGKGQGNRVFNHVACALEKSDVGDKYDLIREINAAGHVVRHVILRHGLDEDTAFDVEAALIDFCSVAGVHLTNAMLGHGTENSGLMTTDEVIRRYSAQPLTAMEPGCVIININKLYQRGSGPTALYEATRKSWVISQKRVNSLTIALAEYRGLIVEVFSIEEWYPVVETDPNKKQRTRWAFHGHVADESIRCRYINRAVPKPRGAANPIRYKF